MEVPGCRAAGEGDMNDRDFWLMVRRALLMFVKAIELRFGIGGAKEG